MVNYVGGHGSGFVVDANSVITARHVSEGKPIVWVETQDGQVYMVVREEEAKRDASRLYVDRPFDVPPLTLSPAPVVAGERVLVIGTPGGRGNFNAQLPGDVVKVGVDADYGYGRATGMVLIDAHCWKGTSGGPVLREGQVVGIVVIAEAGLTGMLPVSEFREIVP
jgi:S1-C subfamily serine protease